MVGGDSVVDGDQHHVDSIGDQLHVDGDQLLVDGDQLHVDGGHCGQPPLCSAQSHQSPFSTKA